MTAAKTSALTGADLLTAVTSGRSSELLRVELVCAMLARPREEVLAMFTDSEELFVGDWRIKFHRDRSWLCFDRLGAARPAAENAGAFDAVAVGLEARQRCDKAAAVGVELSATEAVSRILRERGLSHLCR